MAVDKAKIEEAVKLLIEGIGEDPDRDGLLDTPKRVARMYEEIFAGYEDDAKTHLSRVFESPAGEMVVEKNITFYSTCEHHIMPFYGQVHIGYIPNGKVVGISKLARTVEVYAKRLQVQERMTEEIADALMKELNPKGVIVVANAEHMCMTMRGIKKPGTKTTTISTRGSFEHEGIKNDFFRLLSI